jgi:hypothetical protein
VERTWIAAPRRCHWPKLSRVQLVVLPALKAKSQVIRTDPSIWMSKDYIMNVIQRYRCEPELEDNRRWRWFPQNTRQQQHETVSLHLLLTSMRSFSKRSFICCMAAIPPASWFINSKSLLLKVNYLFTTAELLGKSRGLKNQTPGDEKN